MTARKIGVFTGSRSEYGLLVPVLRAIEAEPALELVLIAGNTHVGGDAEEFPVAAEVPIVRDGEDAASTSRAIGKGVLGITEALQRLKVDVFVVYGDRFEAFAAMIAATHSGAEIDGDQIVPGHHDRAQVGGPVCAGLDLGGEHDIEHGIVRERIEDDQTLTGVALGVARGNGP